MFSIFIVVLILFAGDVVASQDVKTISTTININYQNFLDCNLPVYKLEQKHNNNLYIRYEDICQESNCQNVTVDSIILSILKDDYTEVKKVSVDPTYFLEEKFPSLYYKILSPNECAESIQLNIRGNRGKPVSAFTTNRIVGIFSILAVLSTAAVAVKKYKERKKI
jgi:hypothetical protein